MASIRTRQLASVECLYPVLSVLLPWHLLCACNVSICRRFGIHFGPPGEWASRLPHIWCSSEVISVGRLHFACLMLATGRQEAACEAEVEEQVRVGNERPGPSKRRQLCEEARKLGLVTSAAGCCCGAEWLPD
ncbi:unnamed protein product [Protopolystoma xenopodis]|uniref:Uncharacterized protein n=1 Tax=Protopolystoma xenopodis TaxID=117903 RepID=A0A3S5AZ76_9PLAT|nr:unnamed protein product [Protopolystoma xenopodis]